MLIIGNNSKVITTTNKILIKHFYMKDMEVSHIILAIRISKMIYIYGELISELESSHFIDNLLYITNCRHLDIVYAVN